MSQAGKQTPNGNSTTNSVVNPASAKSSQTRSFDLQNHQARLMQAHSEMSFVGLLMQHSD